MDLPLWEHDLRADLDVIETLLSEMEKVSPSDDAKLQHLKAHLLEKIASPINPGNKKVLLFTAFADTADYLYEHLAPVVRQRFGLHTARVVGSDRPKSTLARKADYQELLTLFSPISKDKALLMPEVTDEIDLLIATDCISEGQNLQDCDYLVNYDIHWNPVRIIQRFGRIDRIGSKNASIQLVNFWPDISLDEYIRLRERVESRMVIADVAATGDENPLDGRANDLAYRKEQLRRMQEEVIELEDLKTGVSITDLGLNDFRMDLVNYIKEHGDLPSCPAGCTPFCPQTPSAAWCQASSSPCEIEMMASTSASSIASILITWSTWTWPATRSSRTRRSSICSTSCARLPNHARSQSRLPTSLSIPAPMMAAIWASTPAC